MDQFAEGPDAGLECHDELLLLDFPGFIKVEHVKNKLEFDGELFATEDDLKKKSSMSLTTTARLS